MSTTPRAAFALAVLAVASPFVSSWVVEIAAVALVAAVVVDALVVRGPPRVERDAPPIVVRGVPATLRLVVEPTRASRLVLRQPFPPDLELAPARAEWSLEATLVGRRRGRHLLPAAAARTVGPLGLGAWTNRVAGEAEVLVYPDVPGARRLAAAVRRGRFREEGRRTRGPLGLGTDFESLRDYSPDDDVRQVNWLASARLDRPISNQFRVERDRDVVCLVDCGRLMGAPLGDATRLDLAVDAAVSVAAVADVLGDRCGAIAFGGEVRRVVSPRRAGSSAVVRALFDVEPEPAESAYEVAFQQIGGSKRAFVLVLTDLLEETAARPLLDALPVLARRHAVAVASIADSELEALASAEPERPLDVFRAAVALEVLDARAAVATRLRHVAAQVVEAPPDRFAAACVRSYLQAKAGARL